MNNENREKLNKIPLRERKAAKIKLSLKDAMLELLLEKNLDDISIKELCQRIEISEGTFFNYFAEKKFLLVYFIQLWSLEVQAIAKKTSNQTKNKKSGFEIIRKVFEHTASIVTENPQIMAEILAYQAKNPRPGPLEITQAERLMAFPDLPETESYPAQGIAPIILDALEIAIKCGELPEGIDLPSAQIQIASIFMGTPIVLGMENYKSLGAFWAKSLDTVFLGFQK